MFFEVLLVYLPDSAVTPFTGAVVSVSPRAFEGSVSEVEAGTGTDDVSFALVASSAEAGSVAAGLALFTS